MQLVEPQSQIIPGIVSVEKKKPSISGVQRRMGLAYDKLVMAAEEREASLSPKTIRTLGRLVLEFEQVNENLASIQAQIRQDIREKKRIFDEEKKLNKKEEDNLTSLRAGLFETRGKIAAFSALVAGKALLEGRVGDAAQSGALAIGAMLPEIVNIASTLVLGRLALGRGAGSVAGSVARGGMRMPRGLGMLGIGAAATIPFAMAGSASADERRRELVKKQTETASINSEDVERFQSILTRFDAIISKMGGEKKAEEPKTAIESELDKNGKPIPKDPGGNYTKTGITIKDEKKGLEELGVSQEQYNAYKQGVADIEGARYDQMGGAGGAFAGRYQMGSGEIASAARIMGITPPTRQEYLSNPELQEKIYMGRTIYMHRRMMDLSPKYRGMSSLERLKLLGGGQLGEGSLQQYIERGTTIRDSNNVEIQRWIKSVERRLEKVPAEVSRIPGDINKTGTISSQKNAEIAANYQGKNNVSVVQIPGGTNVAKPSGPKTAPSSTNVAFNNNFESVDRLQSQVTLGVFG